MPISLPAGRPHAGRAALLAAAVAVLALALSASTASAAVTCTFNATQATATVTSNSYDTIRIAKSAAGAIQYNNVNCGAATATNTNTVKVIGDSDGQTVEVDLAKPLLGGKTSEGTLAVSEIELQVVLAGGYDQLRLLGSTAANNWRLGTTGLNYNSLNDNDGDDVVWSGVDFGAAQGLAGNDVISADGGDGTGAPLSKSIQLFGGLGNDTLTGGAGGDTIHADHDDPYSSPTTGGTDTVHGGQGGDTISGGPAADTLNGGDDSDYMCGGLGNDAVNGGSASDTFETVYSGGCDQSSVDGGDTYTGGSGRDRISYYERQQNIHVSLDNVANDGADTTSPANGTADELDNVRADVEDVDGGEGNDVLNANTPAANAAVTANQLRGYDGLDKLYGGVNDDYLDGGDAADVLDGGAENDMLWAGDGNDSLKGGDGNDTLDASTGKDTISGDAGNDYLPQDNAVDNGDVISGGTGQDNVSYSGRVQLMRISLDNVANDGADADISGTAEEVDNVKADVEEIRTGSGNDVINADTPAANAAGLDNDIDGGQGNDTIRGGTGEDTLYGWDGADTLVGGLGEDVMYGGAQKDTFTAADGYFDRIDGGYGDGINDVGTFDAFDEKTYFP